MYVVRLAFSDGRPPDFKAFDGQASAKSRFDVATRHPRYEGIFETVALFEVAADDARIAIDAVKAADKSRVAVLDVYPQSINLDITGLDL